MVWGSRSTERSNDFWGYEKRLSARLWTLLIFVESAQ